MTVSIATQKLQQVSRLIDEHNFKDARQDISNLSQNARFSQEELVDFFFQSARLYNSLHDYEKAETAARKAISIDRKTSEAVTAKLCSELARSLFEQKKDGEFKKVLTSVCKLKKMPPENRANLHHNFARDLVMFYDYEAAVKYARKALKFTTDPLKIAKIQYLNASIQSRLGNHYLAMEHSIQGLMHLFRVSPLDIRVHDKLIGALALAYFKTENPTFGHETLSRMKKVTQHPRTKAASQITN